MSSGMQIDPNNQGWETELDDIGEDINAADIGALYNNSAGKWVRFAWSRVASFIGAASWDGDITDIDETSSSDIAENLADADQIIVYNASSGGWVRSALSRMLVYTGLWGTYTPTITNDLNLTTYTLLHDAHYTRVGKIVTVDLALQLQATATGLAVAGITLPIASELATDSYDLNGNATTPTASFPPGSVIAEPTGNTAQLYIYAPATSSNTWRVIFRYEIL